jgi:hypothetical protein
MRLLGKLFTIECERLALISGIDLHWVRSPYAVFNRNSLKGLPVAIKGMPIDNCVIAHEVIAVGKGQLRALVSVKDSPPITGRVIVVVGRCVCFHCVVHLV